MSDPVEGFDRLKQATIVMVDDEPIMTDVIQMFLQEAGYQNCLTVNDSAGAVARIKEAAPDIVLTDLVMPKVSGFDVLQAIREDRDLERLPVIVLTSSTDAATKLRALELGATDFLAKPVDPSELVLRLRNALAARSYQDGQAANAGPGGLLARREFEARLTGSLDASAEQGRCPALLHVVFGKVKAVNDVFGRHVGDQLLTDLAARLLAAVGSPDAELLQGGAFVGRLGGVEFAVALADAPEARAVHAFAAGLLNALQAPLGLGGRSISIDTAIGIARYPNDGEDVERFLVAAADAAVAAAKAEGERIALASSGVTREPVRLKYLEASLPEALANGELSIRFRPRYALADDSLTGLEATVEWQQAVLGLVTAGEVALVAARTGLAQELGGWFVRETCASAAHWQSNGEGAPVIHIPISITTLRDPEAPVIISRAVADAGLAAGRVALQMGEEALSTDVEAAYELVQRLRPSGMRFGVAQSSDGCLYLNALRRLGCEQLNVKHSSFVAERDTGDNVPVWRALRNLTAELGMRLSVRAVDEQSMLEFLREHGCDEYQGAVGGDETLETTRICEMLAAR